MDKILFKLFFMNYFKNLTTTYSLLLSNSFFIPDGMIIITVHFYYF